MSDLSIPHKSCSKCQLPKPLSEFHRCSKGKDGYKSACKSCRCAETRDYAQRNPEKVAESKREWERQNREKVNLRLLTYANDNREVRRATGRRSYHRHKEEARFKRAQPDAKLTKRLYDERRYEDQAETIKARVRAWGKKNPEIVLAQSRNKRARLRGAPGTHSPADIQLQLKAQGSHCWWCSKKLAAYHVDHKIPLIRGGANSPDNLCLACPKCNLKKGKKTPAEWNGRLF